MTARCAATSMVLLAMLVGCAAQQPGTTANPVVAKPAAATSNGEQLSVAYSAVQGIDTIAGPFENRIYVSADRERQDASLGGGVVTTIIRRDKGVAWLLIPAKKTYEEIPLEVAASASVQTRFGGMRKKLLARERLDGFATGKFACYDADGRYVADVWLTDDGIAVKAEFFEDARHGQPKAVVTLKQVRIEAQDASLFELPSGYQQVNAR